MNYLNKEGFEYFVGKMKTDLSPIEESEDNQLIIKALESNAKDINIDGNSEQKQYEGYQLLNISDHTLTSHGVTTITKDNKINCSGTIDTNWANISSSSAITCSLQANKIYTFVLNKILNYELAFKYNNNIEIKIPAGSIYKTYTPTTEKTELYYFILATEGTSINITDLQLMIYEGEYDENKTFEPYVGGQPSPNPDYPQEIEVVNEVNLLSDIGWERKTAHNETQITDSTARIMSDYIKIEATEDYYVSIQNSDYCFINIILYDKNKNQFGTYYNTVSQTINGAQNLKINFPNNTKYARFVIGNIDDISEITLEELPIIKPMVVKGTTSKPYLPYGHIGLKQSGKNSMKNDFPKTPGYLDNAGKIWDDSPRNERCYDYLAIKGNTNYTFNIVETGDSTEDGYWFGVAAYTDKSETSYISTLYRDKSNTSSVSFTTPSNAKYVRISGRYLANATKIQLEENSTPTSYESYHEPITYDIDLNGNELCKIGDVKDELDVTTGVLTKRIGKIILNGTESWEIKNKGKRFKLYEDYFTESNKPILIPVENVGPIRCNYFTATSAVNTWYGVTGISYDNYDSIDISCTSIATDVDSFKTWLSTNPVTVYYVLATPQIIQLTPTQVKMWEGTNILETITNLETNLSIEYYKSNLLTDNVIKEVIEVKSDIINIIGDINTTLSTLAEVSE